MKCPSCNCDVELVAKKKEEEFVEGLVKHMISVRYPNTHFNMSNNSLKGLFRDNARAAIKYLWESIEWELNGTKMEGNIYMTDNDGLGQLGYAWKSDLAKKWGIQDV